MPARPIKRNPFTEGGKTLVSMARDTDVYSGVEKAVGLIGGIGKMKVRNKIVLVKPNVNSDDPFPGTTNPNVVGAVVRLLSDAGAERVIVADQSNSFYLPTVKSMERVGIKSAAESEGAFVTGFEDYPWVQIRDPRMEHLKSVRVSRLIYDAERIVSVPVVKTHSLEAFSMSLKNWVGIIHPKDRYLMHLHESVAQRMIPEIGVCVHPDLMVMDGTVCMVAGGPFKGVEKRMDLVIASGDRIANDVVGLGIIKHFRAWPAVCDKGVWEADQIHHAVELGLGVQSPERIHIRWGPTKDTQLRVLAEEVRGCLTRKGG